MLPASIPAVLALVPVIALHSAAFEASGWMELLSADEIERRMYSRI